MIKLLKLKWKFYYLKQWLYENIAPHLPKIPMRKPEYDGVQFCVRCATPIKIYAIDTGEGWMFFWDCEGQHIIDGEDESMIVGWFPFLFGWATARDLEKIGIEVF